MDSGVINFEVYENGDRYLGMAELTLPNAELKTITSNGAGIAGDVELPVTGQRNAQKMTIKFIDNPAAKYVLMEQRRHILDCRIAHEALDEKSGELKIVSYKHILECYPVTETAGGVKPASSQGASLEMSVVKRKDFINNKLMYEFDPIGWVDRGPDGVNRLAPVARSLGYDV